MMMCLWRCDGWQRWTAGVVTGVSGYMCGVKLCDGRHYRRHVDRVRRRVSGVAEGLTLRSAMLSPSAYANPDLGSRSATEESVLLMRHVSLV